VGTNAAVDRSFGHHASARGIVPFLWIHALDLGTVFTHDHLCPASAIVWSSNFRHAVELKLVTSGHDRVANSHPHILLCLITSDHSDADDENRDTKVRELHSVVAATLHPQLLKYRELSGRDANTFPQVKQPRCCNPKRQK